MIDADLLGDPYEAMDHEAARIEAHLGALPDGSPEWARASCCAGWTVRDVLAHLLASEDYHQACLAGRAAAYLEAMAARGAADIATFNAMGLTDFVDWPPSQLLAEWCARDAETRRGFRGRDGGSIDTSVGAYPARWQAFHVASELATHADDMFVPVSRGDAASRVAWRAPFSRFALREAKPDLAVQAVAAGSTSVRAPGVDLEVDDETFVEAVAGRLADPDLAVLSIAV
jgi:uncharacterized protein (TIGR03083 family)